MWSCDLKLRLLLVVMCLSSNSVTARPGWAGVNLQGGGGGEREEEGEVCERKGRKEGRLKPTCPG